MGSKEKGKEKRRKVYLLVFGKMIVYMLFSPRFFGIFKDPRASRLAASKLPGL